MDGERQPRVAESGGRLCAPCLSGLERDLSRLPGLYTECGRALVGSRRFDLERVRGGSVRGLEPDESVLAARAETVSILASWARLVVEERGLRRRPRRDVRDLAAFLRTHRVWLAGHAAAGEAVREIRDLVRGAERVLGATPVRRVALGTCDRDGCGRVVHAVMREQHPRRPAEVGCESGHVWAPHEWLSLRRRMDRQAAGRSRPGWTSEGTVA